MLDAGQQGQLQILGPICPKKYEWKEFWKKETLKL